MPNLRCYDNGGKTADRYTVVYLDYEEGEGAYACMCMDDQPFHPQGFGQHSIATPGRHLGRRVKFEELPADCQKAVLQDFVEE